MTVTTIKPEFAPAMELIPGFGGLELGSSTPESRIVNVTLQSGSEIGFRFLDVDGNPVPDVFVRPGRWNGVEPLSSLPQSGIPRQADAEGEWAWDWTPEGTVTYRFAAPGFRDESLSVSADGSTREVTLEREQVITGRVIDADTGEPIPLFYVEPGYPSERRPPVDWIPSYGTRGIDGEYRMGVSWARRDTLHYRVRAEGYEPAESAAVRVGEGEVTLDFELHRAESNDGADETSQFDAGALDVSLLAQAKGCLTRRYLILAAVARDDRLAAGP